jgi:hypothetical protein
MGFNAVNLIALAIAVKAVLRINNIKIPSKLESGVLVLNKSDYEGNIT